MPATRPLTDPQALRAVAHPARLRLYEILSAEGPATVSQLAERLGARVGTLSYHLRQLASYGYIEEASELAHDRRERWWRAVPGGLRWSELTLADTPGGREASDAAQRVLLGRQLDRLRGWYERADEWNENWRAAAFSTDMLLSLTPSELKEFSDQISEVVHRWAEHSQRSIPDDGTGDSENAPVFFFAHAFPLDDDNNKKQATRTATP